MLARNTPKHLAPGLLAFAFAWLFPVLPAFAQVGERSGSSLTADAPVATSPAESKPVHVLQPPLVPELLGPALVPMRTPAPPGLQAHPVRKSDRALLPLYVSYATLQALDVHSTLSAVRAGGFEQNSIMAPLVNRPAAFVAFKAGVTAATLFAANRLSKHNRVASYALMIGLNSAYAVVVAHNYRVGSQRR